MLNSLSLAWRLAKTALGRNRKRTLLTLLGTIVGSATLVIVLAVGAGVEQVIQSQLGVLTPDTIFVEIRVPSSVRASGGFEINSITSMVEEDREDIVALPSVSAVTGWYTGQASFSYGREQRTATMLGVHPSYTQVQNVEVEHGRFFSERENAALSSVIVLGPGLAEDLAGTAPMTSLLNQNISLDNRRFRVIGIMESQDSSGFFDPDDQALLPINTGHTKIWGIDHFQAMIVEVADIDRLGLVAEQVRRILRQNHDIDDPEDDDFEVATFDQVQSIVGDVTAGITLLLGAIAGISLLVGGVGIMNVMYVTVTERTREIGLRKSLGAPPSAILTQFLVEALLITGLGGLGGSLIGALIGWLASIGASAAGFAWAYTFPVQAVLFATGISLSLGFVFGLAPARSAAKMDPITALRSE